MSCPSAVACHPRRIEIDGMLGAGARIDVVAQRFGLSRFSVGRYRKRLKESDKQRWRALRRAAADAGLKRSDFPIPPANESP